MSGLTPTGYPFPNGTDPVRDGDNVARSLATIMQPNAYPFSGQPPLAGGLVIADLAQVVAVFYNYSMPTDAFGIGRIPTPFTKAIVSAQVVSTDFRQVVAVSLATEFTDVQNLGVFVYDRATGAGKATTNVSLSALIYGL